MRTQSRFRVEGIVQGGFRFFVPTLATRYSIGGVARVQCQR
jgi:hypothetical protein